MNYQTGLKLGAALKEAAGPSSFVKTLAGMGDDALRAVRGNPIKSISGMAPEAARALSRAQPLVNTASGAAKSMAPHLTPPVVQPPAGSLDDAFNAYLKQQPGGAAANFPGSSSPSLGASTMGVKPPGAPSTANGLAQTTDLAGSGGLNFGAPPPGSPKWRGSPTPQPTPAPAPAPAGPGGPAAGGPAGPAAPGGGAGPVAPAPVPRPTPQPGGMSLGKGLGYGALGIGGLGLANEGLSALDQGLGTSLWDPQRTGWNPEIHQLRLDPYQVGVGNMAFNAAAHPLQTIGSLFRQPLRIDEDLRNRQMNWEDPVGPKFMRFNPATGKVEATGTVQGQLNPILSDYMSRQQQYHQDTQSIVDMINQMNGGGGAAPGRGGQQQPSYSVGGMGPIPNSRLQRHYLTMDSVGGM